MIVSGEKTLLKQELYHIKDIMVQNEYPETFQEDHKIKQRRRR